MSPFTAEVLGTMFMILLGNGVVANVVLKGTKGNNGGWMVITTAWALAVFVGVVIAGPYSTAHLNPAVTIGLAIAGKFPWADAPLYIAAQFLGAMLGSFLVWLLFKDFYAGTEDKGAKQATFCTAPAIPNTISNLISEILGTFVLLFVIFHFTNAEMGADKSPIGLGSIGALPVTFLVWVIGLSLGGTTGYAINPARDLGPRIMHAILPVAGKGDNNWGYAWIPVIGPVIGSALAAMLYMYVKV
ncbi:glycerol uptake facilitator protein [Pedobacter africanus]|uniref:Glycerol uptake facilitator protein n=1 Tax=Pedobacter africanus TaxID=151894 RepID=A0ACC6KX04_9SPHI|nr:MIP/aquaporin family protein [Pedobacter africanus]MDR6783682.1 glycerol uptake facilitator protein [Pedobacter africanus]